MVAFVHHFRWERDSIGGHRAGADRSGQLHGMLQVGGDRLDRLRTVAVPAFLTMLMIPLTFSIANGLAFRITLGRCRRFSGANFAKSTRWWRVLTLLFLARFYMGKG